MAKQMVRKVARTVAKQTVQPSKVMGFAPSVAVERHMYRESMFDSPDYWSTEYGYLGQDSGGDAAATPAAPSAPWYQQLIDVYGAYKAQELALKQQDQLAKENAARASTGKPPLNMSDYMKYTAPQVNVGLSPTVMNLLIYGGIGLAAILIIPRLLPNRR